MFTLENTKTASSLIALNLDTTEDAVDAMVIGARKAALTAQMVTRIDEKLNEPATTSANRKKLDRMKRWFLYGERGLQLLAEDDADVSHLAKQIYANDKLIDFVNVAVHGHLNQEFISPKMHGFMLRALLTFKRLRDANAPIDYLNVIRCAMNGELKPTNNGDLYLFGKVGYSSEATQSGQVMNVFRTLRIIDETKADKSQRVNLDTVIARKVLAVLENLENLEPLQAK